MFEPTKPTLAVATEAYGVLSNLSRWHPEDVELANEAECARHLMTVLWNEREAERKAAV